MRPKPEPLSVKFGHGGSRAWIRYPFGCGPARNHAEASVRRLRPSNRGHLPLPPAPVSSLVVHPQLECTSAGCLSRLLVGHGDRASVRALCSKGTDSDRWAAAMMFDDVGVHFHLLISSRYGDAVHSGIAGIASAGTSGRTLPFRLPSVQRRWSGSPDCLPRILVRNRPAAFGSPILFVCVLPVHHLPP